uniref:Uncharacterized protein n=1 Tax=Rhizophora mucronata TaxID=61149 RepID=A0A2P2QEI6_RHIMU
MLLSLFLTVLLICHKGPQPPGILLQTPRFPSLSFPPYGYHTD